MTAWPGTVLAGFQAAAPAERASFGILSASALTIATSRVINYVLERRRAAPRVRSLLRRAYHAPGSQDLRVHHFLPGIGLVSVSGAAAIVASADGREFWLSLPFGVGAGLTLDEIGLLLKADNPYWAGERPALIMSGISALAAAALGAKFGLSGRQATASPQ